MSTYGATVTILVTQLAEAVAKDEAPGEGGFDLSAGMLGAHVSEWIRETARELEARSAETERLRVRNYELLNLLTRCQPIIESDALMMADISRHAPLDFASQAEHDSTEYESERLVRELESLLLAENESRPMVSGREEEIKRLRVMNIPCWRHVADELPEEAQEVLFVRNGKTRHGAWIGGIFWYNGQKVAAEYWMPLPEEPKACL